MFPFAYSLCSYNFFDFHHCFFVNIVFFIIYFMTDLMFYFISCCFAFFSLAFYVFQFFPFLLLLLLALYHFLLLHFFLVISFVPFSRFFFIFYHVFDVLSDPFWLIIFIFSLILLIYCLLFYFYYLFRRPVQSHVLGSEFLQRRTVIGCGMENPIIPKDLICCLSSISSYLSCIIETPYFFVDLLAFVDFAAM